MRIYPQEILLSICYLIEYVILTKFGYIQYLPTSQYSRGMHQMQIFL